jgi:DNA-binding ferritin-like protein
MSQKQLPHMAEPGLAFGAFGAAVRSAELLAWIIKKTQEVRRLKGKCREIQQHAEMLQAILQDNEAVLKDLKMKMKLDETLRDVAIFVLHCIQDTNLVQRAW